MQIISKQNHIRWYHWLVYRMYHHIWTPILKRNPQMVRLMLQHMQQWLDQNAVPTDSSKQPDQVDTDLPKSECKILRGNFRNIPNEFN